MDYGFGIDIGGTAIKLGLFTREGELLEHWELPTDTGDGGSRILPDIAGAVDACMARRGIAREKVLALGVGVPGPVTEAGVVKGCVNLGWGETDVPRLLGELTGFPVACGNDANLAALGECWQGGGRGAKSLVMVTLGTGIGGGIVLDGKILPGAHGGGGEIGHIPMNEGETTPCSCGKYGCAEQYGSATALLAQAKRRLEESAQPSSLREYDPLTVKDIFFCAARGDAMGQELCGNYYRFLGRHIAGICCVIDPELVVLGGGVAGAGQPLLEGIREHFRREVFHPGRDIPFALAELGNRAGIYGAFKLGMDTMRG